MIKVILLEQELPPQSTIHDIPRLNKVNAEAEKVFNRLYGKLNDLSCPKIPDHISEVHIVPDLEGVKIEKRNFCCREWEEMIELVIRG